MGPADLAAELKERAAALGFSGCRVARAEPFPRELEALVGRIKGGLNAEMHWLNVERAEVATDPGALVPGARSLVSVAMPYARREHRWRGEARGRIARYAWARDYHGVMKARLGELRDFLVEAAGGPDAHAAVVVDTGRVVDRAVAVRAGLGWYGKNAMVLTPEAGSWVMLGELITTVELSPDQPLAKACGRCTRCLEQCPTGALIAPGVVDSRRCISYLTIEHRGPISRQLRPLMGSWIFGCDICQEVCPVGAARSDATAEPLAPVLEPEPELAPLLELTAEQFRERYRETPVGRAGWAGFLRNVCVALGNVGDETAVPALTEALRHPEPLVRGHAAWALGRIGGEAARAALTDALAAELEVEVRTELSDALCHNPRPCLNHDH
jgi:epoxyqueuosine reductase